MNNIPLIAFATIAAVTLLLLTHRVFKTFARRHRLQSSHSGHHHHIIEMGREWEEIYVPGDKIIRNDYDYEEYDDDL